MAGFDNVRQTMLGTCIGATIIDITAVDQDEFLAGAPNYVYFHLSNGETIFATMGTEENPGLMGLLATDDSDNDDEDEADGQHENL